MAHLLHHRMPASGYVEVERVEERPTAIGLVGEVLVLAAAVPMVLSGAIAMMRAGLGGDLAIPTVHVFGYTHTAWLGIGELAAGIVLLLAAAFPALRPIGVVIGVVMVVGAVLVRARPHEMPLHLMIEPAYAWFLLPIGAAAVIGGALPTGRVSRFGRRVVAD